MKGEERTQEAFGAGKVAKSVLIFFVNYLLLFALIFLFIALNAVNEANKGFAAYMREDISDFVYLLLSVFILFVIIYIYFLFEDRQSLAGAKNIWLVFILLDVSIVVCYFFGFFFNIYSRPVAMLALLALLLLGRRFATFLNVIFALMMFAIDHFTNFSVTGVNATAAVVTPLLTFSAGMVGIFVGTKVKTRVCSFLTGFAVCVPLLVMIACLEYGSGVELLYSMLFGLEAGVCSAVLFMALLPVFEVVFNCITDYRLRELTDHDAPLMRELKERAFGTFNHCIVVAHLAEACAIALNEDTALARAAAYYHDVGKLRQPEYFTENQSGYNPHNELSPELSVDIIRSHAKDGYELIRARRLPKVLADIGKHDEKVVAITAARADGAGLSRFARMFPNRFFDVGIAEEHAMTFAAGLAAGGMKPVFAVYSSFLQRAFDQTIHDVCLQNLPVVIAVDRAGLVGSDGETHQGVFDLSYLSMIPNMTIMSPKNRWEMADMLRFAVEFPGPVALRYPRGTAYEGLRQFRAPVEFGKSEILYEEGDIAVIFVGHMSELAEQVRMELKDTGYACSLVNARFVKPLDTQMLENLAEDHSLFVTIEENVFSGGFGEQVLEYVNRAKLNVRVRNIAISDDYVEHGNVELLRKEVGLDKEAIVKQAVSDYLMIKDR